MNNYNEINWTLFESKIKKQQDLIIKEWIKGNKQYVNKLQKDLVTSYAARAYAVKQVITNKGGLTPGVDGIIWTKNEDKIDAINKLKNDIIHGTYKAISVKRVWIPKSKGNKRSLGIPTLYDRAMQALWSLALLPIAEITADSNSFGYIKGLNTHNALGIIRKDLSKMYCPRWVLEGNIEGFFDNISHLWILENIPIDKTILSEWLKAGVLENEWFTEQQFGVSQGGIISPIIANMALDNLEEIVKQASNGHKKVKIIRYVDDFIVTGVTPNQLLGIQKEINEFLQKRGLTLNMEKTLLTEIESGFNFLGINFKEYPDKKYAYGNKKGILLATPTKAAVNRIRDKVDNLIKISLNWEPGQLIEKYNYIVIDWANYYCYYNSVTIFKTLATEFWQKVWKWAIKKYPKDSAKSIMKKCYISNGRKRNVLYGIGKNSKKIIMFDLSKKTIIRYNQKILKDL